MSAFVLDVPMQGSLFGIFLISTIYILLALAFGLLVSNIAETQLEALLFIGYGVAYAYSIALWNDIPHRVDATNFTICICHNTYPILYQCYAKTNDYGVSIKEVYHEIAILVGMLVVLLSLSLAKFNKRLD